MVESEEESIKRTRKDLSKLRHRRELPGIPYNLEEK